MKGKVFGVVLWLGFIAVSAYAVHPFFMDALLGIEHVTTIGAYDKKVAAKSSAEIDRMWQDAWEYNKKVALRQKTRAFTYMGGEATDEVYESLLRIGDDNTMGSVQVPAAGIDLPIAHGTANEYLDKEAGHVYGTSLPVGGESSHALIAGHTGLRNADIFTNLHNVTEGDMFYISVLNKKLAYKIVSITVVKPEDENPYLQVVNGRDLVTLYTCTPYGVNSHRLLVLGERDKSAEAPDGGPASGDGVSVSSRDMMALLRCIGFGAVPVAVAVLMWLFLFGGRKKQKREAAMAGQPKASAPAPEIPPEAEGDWFCTIDAQAGKGWPRHAQGKDAPPRQASERGSS